MRSINQMTEQIVKIAKRESRAAAKLGIGRVTAIDSAVSPKTVLVDGRTLAYLDSYTPVIGDRVRYFDGVVLGKITL